MSVLLFARWSTMGRPGAALAAALLLVGCARGDRTGRDLDDTGHPLPSPAARARIVSLSPTTTELLFALGAGDRLVGRTHWDTWPEAARRVADLGDGIRPSIEAVLAVRPDLVVLYATGENADAARAFRAAGIDVVSLRVDRIEEFERAARILGDVIGEPDAATLVVDTVRATLDRVRAVTGALARPRVFLHAWESPLLTIGGGSYLTQLVDIAGGTNVFADLPQPSPQVSFEEVLRRNPDFVLGSPATLRTLRETPRWRQLPAVREGRFLETDSTLLGRPGVRLGEAAVFLARLLHAGAIP
jgi:ABC-type Fe3+-hydroxamate transport system substrate-binding protein